MRLERVRRGESNHMAAQILRQIFGMADLVDGTRGKRFVNLFTWIRRQTCKLTSRHAIGRRASFAIDRIRKEVHEADTVIQHLWRRNQRAVWRNFLRAVLRVEIRSNEHSVPVPIERSMKCRVAIVRRIEKQIKHYNSRARRKKLVEQKRPDFSRPRERPLGHELKRAVTRQFFRSQWR